MNDNLQKDFKQAGKEAKKRLKSGFWANYGEKIAKSTENTKREGVSISKVVEYYESKTENKKKSEDKFYLKVCELVKKEGEVGDAIGRLIDHDEFDALTYDGKQKYILELSEKYRKALIRLNQEKNLD